jgi:SnoaL-like domain
MNDLERKFCRLQAAEDIRNLKARYAIVCDTGYKPKGMRPLFTKDAVWDGGRFGRHEGVEAICGFFAGVSKEIVWALHYMVNPIIELDDNLETARGSWYLWQPCTVTTPQGPKPVWLTGTYADRYRKVDGVWRFSEVNLAVQTISPFDEGWAKRRFWDE